LGALLRRSEERQSARPEVTRNVSDDAVGHSAEATWQVDRSLCTERGGRYLLSTPSLVLLMERTSMEAVAPFLGEGETTVGTEVNVRHLAPTPEGGTVLVHATVRERDGRRFRLDVEAFDELDQIGVADHERFVVGIERYLARLEDKTVRLAEARAGDA
jgi:predicted thioesterase